MSIVLLVMTDGRRECLTRTLERFDEAVTGPITRRVIHDDSADPKYQAWLQQTYPGYELLTTPRRSGFAGAIQSAWRYLETIEEPYVFHLEDDFLFTRTARLEDLVEPLEAQPHLAQVSFRRQRWGTEPEGGFMAQAPDWYVEREGWVETTRNWTTNPSLYRRQIIELGWPDAPDSEGHWGFKLREQGLPWGVTGKDVRFGFWGGMEDGRDWVEHIGVERIGVGY